jgi:hydrogenase maturation protease
MNEWEWQLLEDREKIDRLTVNDVEVRAGNRVRLHPRRGGDVLDIALSGQIAVIESIEQDYEGNAHICVVLDDDPGRDMGLLRQPGHRFFFTPPEIEPLPLEEQPAATAAPAKRILVAGIGNIFLGDDAFGVEVVKRLRSQELPAGVRVVDFGIRGFDLAYALQDGYDTTILVDAFPHGQTPGTVSLVEPDLNQISELQPGLVDAHGMNPLHVLRLAASMNTGLRSIFLVGCEPATLGGEEGHMGLSPPVAAAVGQAAAMVFRLITNILNDPSDSAERSA